MTQPPIRQFSSDSSSVNNNYAAAGASTHDPLVPYFRQAMSLVNEFLIAAGAAPKVKSGKDLALNMEWGYLADNGVYVIETQTDYFPAYFYTPIGQCSPLAFASLSQAQFENLCKKMGFRPIDKTHGQGGNMLAWVDRNVNPDAAAKPHFLRREEVDYHSLVNRWANIRQGLNS